MSQSSKKTWAELSKTQQTVIVVAGAAELVLTSIALVDIVRRPATQVRGPKVMWVASFVVQPVGPIAYLVIGRRRG